MRTSGLITFAFQKSQVYKQLLNDKPEHLLLAYHLMINCNSHMSGFYYYPIAYMAVETKRTEDDLERSIEVLEQNGFMQYEHNESFVWVIEMAYEQSGFHRENDKRRKSTINHISAMPDSVIRDDFIEYYNIKSEISAQKPQGHQKGIRRAYEGDAKVTILSNPIKESLKAQIPNHEISENTPEFPEVNHAK